jgi:hypothetical protein
MLTFKNSLDLYNFVNPSAAIKKVVKVSVFNSCGVVKGTG